MITEIEAKEAFSDKAANVNKSAQCGRVWQGMAGQAKPYQSVDGDLGLVAFDNKGLCACW